MIQLSLDQAVSSYILFFVIIFIGGCAFAFFNENKQWYPKEFTFWRCFICGFVYSSVFDLDMTVCPRCGSYNKKDRDQEAGNPA